MALGARTQVIFVAIVWVLLGTFSETQARSQTQSSIGTFFHVSDIHYDPLYDPQQTPTSMCRDETFVLDRRNIRKNAPPTFDAFNYTWGQYGCDSPQSLVISTLNAMALVRKQQVGTFCYLLTHHKLDNSPDFIILSGDSAAHSLPTQEIALEAIANVSYLINAYFPEVPIYICIGNNDVFPDYYLPYPPNNTWLTNVYKVWQSILPSSAATTFLQGGYYSDMIHSKLKIIVLNTVWYATSHLPNETSLPSDPAGQFAWLSSELESCQQNQQFALIVAHIPPGGNEYGLEPLWYSIYSQQYQDIANQYADVIIGQFFGHLHRDDFRLIWPTENYTIPDQSASTALLLAPSVSPITFENPSFRLLFYSQTPPYTIYDYDSYFADLFSAQTNNSLVWQLEYAFSKAYSVPDVSVSSLQLVYEKIKQDDTLFEQWLAWRDVLYDQQRYIYLCAITALSNAEFSQCISNGVIPPRQHWQKQALDGAKTNLQ